MPTTQEIVDSYSDWYHEIDCGGGVSSRARHASENNRLIWGAIRRFLDGVDFQGKTVLDIGCWDGMWSFEAEKRGAAEVVATDAADQRWGATEGFAIAHRLLGSRVVYRGNVSIYDAPERLGRRRFDIVLFLGVYYHLTHPVFAFTQLRHLVADRGAVVIEGSAINDTDRAYAEFLYGDGPEPERCDASNWTIPTRRWLRDVLEANYFDVVREEFPFGAPRGRALVQAAPRRGPDGHHPYPPPFGLAQYDGRWGGG